MHIIWSFVLKLQQKLKSIVCKIIRLFWKLLKILNFDMLNAQRFIFPSNKILLKKTKDVLLSQTVMTDKKNKKLKVTPLRIKNKKTRYYKYFWYYLLLNCVLLYNSFVIYVTSHAINTLIRYIKLKLLYCVMYQIYNKSYTFEKYKKELQN